MTATHTMEFGVLTVGRFDGRWRHDIYRSHAGDTFHEPCFAAGPNDASPRQTQYDGRCSSCWLHATHTQEYHKANLS